MLRRNVLIFHAGGLGDFILTWPFAVALGRIYPQSRIIYVTHHQKGDLARRVLRLEATDIELGWHGLYAENAALPSTALSLLASAHSVYSFLPTGPTWDANVERISPLAKRVEIDARVPEKWNGHVTNKIEESLADHKPEQAALVQLLRSIAERGIGFKPPGGTDVVIHPGSGSPEKCWPLDCFLALAGALKHTGRNVRFITGEVERDRWSAAELQSLGKTAEHRPCQTLTDLLTEIGKAGIFIGNDSGPSHLAGIIGVPTLALFGPTNENNWKPLGPQVKILRAEISRVLPVEKVVQSVLET